MTDDDREVLIRRRHSDLVSSHPCSETMARPWPPCEQRFLMRRLDEARAGKTPFEMVREFLQANGKACPTSAQRLTGDLEELWHNLDDEEATEYYNALKFEPMVAVAKELADRIYILLGHAATMGLVRFDEIFAEVHRSNMSKLGADGKPVLRADGKILKGEDYAHPDLAPLLTAVPRGT